MVSGETGSGKTSFLNCLAASIPPEQCIISFEDVAELRSNHPNWLSLQALHLENGTEISVKKCLINSLRMRPDRIIIGECRKDEAFEMLQAMNTGPDGSLTTIHANSSVDCLSRLESLINLAGAPIFLRDKTGNLCGTGYVPKKLLKINAETQHIHSSFFEAGRFTLPAASKKVS